MWPESTWWSSEFPPLPASVTSTPSIHISAVAVQGSALYPRPLTESAGRSMLQGGLISVHVRNSTGESLVVRTDGSEPFKFTVPRGLRRAPENADWVSVALQCEYWNVTSQSWQRDGVDALNVSSNGNVHCTSTHLTAFSSSTDFRIRVNTFSSRDITLEAFDPRSNPMVALLISMIAVFAVTFLFAWRHDSRMQRLDHDGLRELDFFDDEDGY